MLIPVSAARISRGEGPPAVTDPPILTRVARGDSAAVRECIDRYGGLVWSLARRFFANTADAEDATQDVFIHLWKSAGAYDPAIASEAVFVTTIARRRLIDGLR